MATIVLFEEFVKDLGDGDHGTLNTATFKCALYTATATFTAADSAPAYSATNECSGTGYTAGGATITGTGYTEASGTGTLAATSAAWTSLTLSTGADWGLIYNDTAASNQAIGYVVLGTVGTSGGDLTLTFTNSKILDIA